VTKHYVGEAYRECELCFWISPCLHAFDLRRYLDRAMIVAVPAAGVMKMPADYVVDMIAVGHGVVSATGAVLVRGIVRCAGLVRCARGRIRTGYSERVLVDMSVVHMM